ncbi:hypothetical protein MIR68_011835 [Amoeboaphelidium protococcarum]|nr:hypothetical protein MIR68_011835 [Amoeboaphelidium protococcarum]
MCYNYDLGSGGRQQSRVSRWSIVFWLRQNIRIKQLIALNKMSIQSILVEFFNGYYLIQSLALWPFTRVLSFVLKCRNDSWLCDDSARSTIMNDDGHVPIIGSGMDSQNPPTTTFAPGWASLKKVALFSQQA